jgi:hypothetical protein
MTEDIATFAGSGCFARGYEPSPVPRIRDQVALYEETHGTQGNTLEDRPVVILTSVGAKSGRVRTNPIMRIEDNGIYVGCRVGSGGTDEPGLVRQSRRTSRCPDPGRRRGHSSSRA